MKTLVKLIMILVVLGNYSCQQKENQNEVEVKKVIEQEDDFKFPAVSLKDGQLWEANSETT